MSIAASPSSPTMPSRETAIAVQFACIGSARLTLAVYLERSRDGSAAKSRKRL
jgi:hypothetical protein